MNQTAVRLTDTQPGSGLIAFQELTAIDKLFADDPRDARSLRDSPKVARPMRSARSTTYPRPTMIRPANEFVASCSAKV